MCYHVAVICVSHANYKQPCHTFANIGIAFFLILTHCFPKLRLPTLKYQIKVKLSHGLIRHPAMKAARGLKVYFHVFLTFALDGRKQLHAPASI